MFKIFKPGVAAAALLSLFLGLWSAQAEPARWTFGDEDTQIVLFGTVHVLQPGLEWLDSGLRSEVERADGLVLELAPEERSPQVMGPLIQAHALLPAGETLAGRIGPELYEKLKAKFAAAGLQEAQYASMRPWFASVNLAAIEFAKSGYRPETGVEQILTGTAGAAGVPVQGLESAEYQITRFANLSPAYEKEMLRITLNEVENAADMLNTLSSAWLMGDLDGLGTILLTEMAKTPELAEVILYERNANWVEDMKQLLAQPGHFVVAVGTGHLVGERNLIDLLQAEGISVSRVPEPAMH